MIFISQIDAYQLSNNDKEKLRELGREFVIVPQNAFDKIKNISDINGSAMGTFDLVVREYQNNFEYCWVSSDKLSSRRRLIWDKRFAVFDWFGDKTWRNKIKISKKINEYISGDTQGVFDSAVDAIIIKEDVLDSEADFYEVLIHEYIHATTNFPDNDRNFENELGKVIGRMGVELFGDKAKDEAFKPENQSLFKRIFGRLK